ncbi:MAG TPA: tetratricopeptide repeat protein [Thermoanaerobaculia bacterium]|jgi:TolA-binding protein
MDRQHRRDLKHDVFVDEVGALTQRARANQRGLLTIAAVALAIAAIAWGVYFYRNTQESKAQAALAEAIETIESPLIPAANAQPGTPVRPDAKFKTEAERSAAAEKQFQAVRANHSGSDAADVAGLYLARMAAAKGDIPGARKLLEEFIGAQPDHLLVGAARFSLLQLRIDNGEAQPVITELNAELSKEEPSLPADSILVLLAKAYESQGNAAKTKETYRRIATEFPDSPYAMEAQRRVGPA